MSGRINQRDIASFQIFRTRNTRICCAFLRLIVHDLLFIPGENVIKRRIYPPIIQTFSFAGVKERREFPCSRGGYLIDGSISSV